MSDNRLGTGRHEDCDLQRMFDSALAEEAEADQLTDAPSTIAAELAVIMDPQAHQGRPVQQPADDTRTFWGALTPEEQRSLIALARGHLYRPGDVLCGEGAPADEVIVIRSGWTRVWVQEGAEERILAVRGPGELIGELATLLIRDQSATVTAESEVQALRVPGSDFVAFLEANPGATSILERQVHERLSPPDSHLETERPVPPDLHLAGNCSILFTDITGFASPARTDADREYVRTAMYDLMDQAFAASDLDFARLYREDRGDGALVIVPPTTPTDQVVDPMLAHLAAALRRHNRRATDATRLQLRVALHVGPVQHNPRGVSGISIITTARMLDAPAVKQRAAETGADLAFVTSDFVYYEVITPAPGLVDPSRYSRVQVQVKETSLSAWLMLEGGAPRLSGL